MNLAKVFASFAWHRYSAGVGWANAGQGTAAIAIRARTPAQTNTIIAPPAVRAAVCGDPHY